VAPPAIALIEGVTAKKFSTPCPAARPGAESPTNMYRGMPLYATWVSPPDSENVDSVPLGPPPEAGAPDDFPHATRMSRLATAATRNDLTIRLLD
jgi:hypothetical protein